tara:strand:- start:896 stop:1468 length:573 start_codon:yes stop_codon:yes gene_type:complete
MRKVLIIGVGGIGSYLTQFLSRLNLYELHIADNDSVEKKNLLYQNFNLEDIGQLKVTALQDRYKISHASKYQILTDKQLKSYDLVICCADNLDVRRLVYRQGHGSHSKVKWLDLRAQGRIGLLSSYLQDPSLSTAFLDGPKGSFSCQADSWDGTSEKVDMMNIVMAAMGSQWVQKWFNKEDVDGYLTVNI